MDETTLPNGWAEATVDDLGEFINGVAFKPEDWTTEGMPIIRIQNLTNPEKLLNCTKRKVENKYIIHAHDILVSWSATLDAFKWRGPDAYVNQHIFKVNPNFNLDEGFVFHALKKSIQELINTEHLHGSTMKHINRKPFLAHACPLPPLNEQRRIVEKIETLFSQLDAGEAALRQVQKQLTRYRQSVLKAAVTGALTADWRAQNAHRLEHGRDLLARILQTRRENWQGRGKYQEPAAPDTRDLPELPEGWAWAKVDQVASAVDYGSSQKCSAEAPGVPVLRMGNIVEGSLNFDDLKYLPEKHEEFPKLLLAEGDLLFNRTNSAELVGKTATYGLKFGKCSFASYLIRVKFHSISSEFVSAFINSPFGRLWIKSVVSQQVGQANVNGSKLKALAIPLPSIEEQGEIVSRMNELIAELINLDCSCQSSLTRCAALRQSILRDAFSGKLVPQDPSDEPAAELLARMRAGRTASAPTNRGRKPARKAAA